MNPQSLEAWTSSNKHARRFEVYRQVCACRQTGTTIDATSEKLGVPPNQISGRFGELVDGGLIVPLLEADGKPVRRRTRAGCWAAVYIAKQFASEADRLFPDDAPPRHLDLG